ncbi:ABC transporter ATP-binding protein [Paraliobacillus sp. JSM ZJ581]|uniref:ABC transporter ATP-binding protein n=1 Tax=Paraliobacillus sp. JSM ZJ581 TaxID=3342118 RepID=UPI0035A85C0C
MITAKNISYTYENTENKALNSLSFSIEQGEIVGLLGHNGAGKTTLLECLCGLREVTEGNIFTDNKKEKLSKKISYVPTDLYLYNMLTVEETILFIGKIYSLSNQRIMDKALPLINQFSLYEKLTEYVKNISFGMKQQLALILGILNSPRYLLLDEPMNGYDALTTNNTKKFLKQYVNNQKAGVLISSHRLDIIEDICDRVIVINNGILIYQGSIPNLKNENSLEDALISILQGEA